MSEDLQISGLTKQMLSDIVDENTFWKEDLAPMPRSKAIWLLSNSRINNDDYCGVIAYEQNKMVAFIFMIPDLINNGSDEGQKAYWMIDWWVTAKYKDSILGTYIYNQAINYANKQVLIKGYTANVEDFYSKQPFTVIASRLRHTIFFSLDSSMLLGRFKFLKPFKFIIDAVDVGISAIIRSINKLKIGSKTQDVNYDFINTLDHDTWHFIEPFCKKDLILKSKSYVDWQIDNNQYLQIPVGGKTPYRNLQTGISNNIHIHNLKIIKNNQVIGFISYVINYNELNVKYFVFDDEHYDTGVNVLIENFIKSKRNFIFTDDTKLADSISKKFVIFFRHKVLKKGLVHNDTLFDYNTVTMLNRDGHFY